MELHSYGLFTCLKMTCWKSRAVLILAILSLFSSASVLGEGIVAGMISGSVLDGQGAVVAGASVRGVQVATSAKFSDKSDCQGYFELKSLPIGLYNLTIEASGFHKLQLSNVVVEAGRSTALGARTLEVGSPSEVVTVEASVPLVESTSSQIGGTFDSNVVGALPNAGVGFDNLALYIPGVANNGSTNFSNTNGAAIANNGLRGRSNNFQIDGQPNHDNSLACPCA